jgi:CHRD domain-containing protein
MRNRKSLPNLVIATGILAMISVAVPALSNISFAAGSQQNFTATLSGKEEVPPNNSAATGWAWLKPTNETIGFKVNVTNIDKVNAAHIHLGEMGKNGDVVVTLFKSDKPTELKNGTLAQGNFTKADLTGPMKDKPLSDLITAMKNGTSYVNVHSTDFPDGEMRGQLKANSTNSTG